MLEIMDLVGLLASGAIYLIALGIVNLKRSESE